MALKSALPIPTITIDKGALLAAMMARFVL